MAFNDSSTGCPSGLMVYIYTSQEVESTAAQVLGLGVEADAATQVSHLDSRCCWQLSLLHSCASQPEGLRSFHCTAEFHSHIKPCIHEVGGFFSTEQLWLDAVTDAKGMVRASSWMARRS